jgi:hypothetical protein
LESPTSGSLAYRHQPATDDPEADRMARRDGGWPRSSRASVMTDLVLDEDAALELRI